MNKSNKENQIIKLRMKTVLLLFLLLAIVASCRAQVDPASLSTICLEVEQDYDEVDEGFSLPIKDDIIDILDYIGIKVASEDSECNASLRIILEGHPLQVSFKEENGQYIKCFPGVEISGQFKLFPKGYRKKDVGVDAIKRPPGVVIVESCPQKPENAAWEEVVVEALSEGMIKIFGPSTLGYFWETDAFSNIETSPTGHKKDIGSLTEIVETMLEEGEIEAIDVIPVIVNGIEDEESYWVRYEALSLLWVVTSDMEDLINRTVIEDDQVRSMIIENGDLLFNLIEVDRVKRGIDTIDKVSLFDIRREVQLVCKNLSRFRVSSFDRADNEKDTALEKVVEEKIVANDSQEEEFVMESISSLIELIEIGDEEISEFAISALEVITGQDYGYDLQKWREIIK